MQVTITVDDDVLAVAKELSVRKGITLGSAVSELARRGTRSASTAPDSIPVFHIPADAAPITSEDVCRALDEWP